MSSVARSHASQFSIRGGGQLVRQVRRRVTKVWINEARTIVRIRVHSRAGYAWIGTDDWARWKDPLLDPSPYVFEIDEPREVLA